jgi:hypothetical protein
MEGVISPLAGLPNLQTLMVSESGLSGTALDTLVTIPNINYFNGDMNLFTLVLFLFIPFFCSFLPNSFPFFFFLLLLF